MPIEDDPSTAVGMVRLLITDTVAPGLFTDLQIEAFLTAEGDNTKRGAALALEVMARSEALIGKKIKTQDLQTDGPAVAAELRASAAALRAQAQAVDDADNEEAFGIDVVPLYQFDCAPPWANYYL